MHIPSLKKKFLYYKNYAKADISSIFKDEILNKALYIDLKMLESTIFINENNIFVPEKMPEEVQYAPVYAITSTDLNDDGVIDLFLGGNQFLIAPINNEKTSFYTFKN